MSLFLVEACACVSAHDIVRTNELSRLSLYPCQQKATEAALAPPFIPLQGTKGQDLSRQSSWTPLCRNTYLKYLVNWHKNTLPAPIFFPFKWQALLGIFPIFPAGFTHSNSFLLLNSPVEIFYHCVFNIKKCCPYSSQTPPLCLMSAEVKKSVLRQDSRRCKLLHAPFCNMEDPLLEFSHLTMKSQHRQAGPDLLELGSKAAAQGAQTGSTDSCVVDQTLLLTRGTRRSSHTCKAPKAALKDRCNKRKSCLTALAVLNTTMWF